MHRLWKSKDKGLKKIPAYLIKSSDLDEIDKVEKTDVTKRLKNLREEFAKVLEELSGDGYSTMNGVSVKLDMDQFIEELKE